MEKTNKNSKASGVRSSGFVEFASLLYLIHAMLILWVCIAGDTEIYPHKSSGVVARNNSLAVCIYDGPGTANVDDYRAALASVLPSNTTFTFLGPDEIISNAFSKYCTLFVMPGGRDIPYCEQLNGQGNKNLREYVEAGGCYYGTCAGAYFGTREVLFDEQNPNQKINATRELEFFLGQARGPLFVPFPEGGPYPALVVISAYTDHEGDPNQVMSDKNFTVLYYGGPFFDYPKLKDGSYKVLAYYPISPALEKTLYLHPERAAYGSQKPPALVAILSINVGKGHVVLTGVHLENTKYDEENKGKDWARKTMLKRILKEMKLPID